MRAKDRYTSRQWLTDMPRLAEGRWETFELENVPFIGLLLAALVAPAASVPAAEATEPAPTPGVQRPTPPAERELVRLPEQPGGALARVSAAQDPAPTPRAEATAAPLARPRPPLSHPSSQPAAPGSVFRGRIVMPRLPATLHHDANSNAILYGEPSFNIRPDEYAPYYKHVRDRIGRFWFTMMASFYAQRGYLVDRVESVMVRFEVARDGTIKQIETIAGSEDPLFESICLRAIRAAKPLRPLPDYVSEPELKILFRFVRPVR